jgi:hypothetical protein
LAIARENVSENEDATIEAIQNESERDKVS